MLTLNELKTCRDFLSQLKERYKIPNLNTKLIAAPTTLLTNASAYAVGLVDMEQTATARLATITVATDRPLPSVLATIAHEYKHCLQYFIENRNIEKESLSRREGEAHAFGYDESVSYLEQIGFTQE